jgi:glycosyltransferase involved in cell wall biosynthesis
MPKKIRQLLIVSHVVHYCFENRVFAYGPYAREIDIWADLFPSIAIAAPIRHASPPPDCLPFTRANISVFPVTETGGDSLRSRIAQLLSLPLLIRGLCAAMRKADAIHVRCPGNLGLLGALLAPLFSRFLVAKYAGQWNGYPGEPWTVRLQRALLRSWWWRGPVTVYGRWPDQPANVIPFFTSILTADQVSRAREAAGNKRAGEALRVLYAGRLSASKNIDTLLEAISLSGPRRISAVILGDGPDRAKLEARAAELGLGDCVRFAGAAPFEQVLEYYDWADALVLTSETEGWPKAIAEAMAFGVICIGSNRGFVPQMLGEGRGIVITPRDATALSSALGELAAHPEKFRSMRALAAEWAQSYSLESLRQALRDLLASNWGAAISVNASAADPQARKVRA